METTPKEKAGCFLGLVVLCSPCAPKSGNVNCCRERLGKKRIDEVCDLIEVRMMDCGCADSVKNRARTHVPMPFTRPIGLVSMVTYVLTFNDQSSSEPVALSSGVKSP